MALVGQVGEYVDGKEDITSSIERVELYFAANYVDSGLRSCYVSIINWKRCIWRAVTQERPKDIFC